MRRRHHNNSAAPHLAPLAQSDHQLVHFASNRSLYLGTRLSSGAHQLTQRRQGAHTGRAGRAAANTNLERDYATALLAAAVAVAVAVAAAAAGPPPPTPRPRRTSADVMLHLCQTSHLSSSSPSSYSSSSSALVAAPRLALAHADAPSRATAGPTIARPVSQSGKLCGHSSMRICKESITCSRCSPSQRRAR